jgi:phosphoglycolate phosphatase
MKHYKNIIFDLDGTLWSANKTTTCSINDILRSFNKGYEEISEDFVNNITGKPSNKFWDEIQEKFKIAEEDMKCLVETVDKDLGDRILRNGADLFDGVSPGLLKLAKKYQLFLISNCPTWYLNNFLDFYKLREVFTDWDCYGSSLAPKSEMIQNMISFHGMEKLETIYIGDTEIDEMSSEYAGIDFGFAKYGYGNAKNPKVVFEKFSDIVKML